MVAAGQRLLGNLASTGPGKAVAYAARQVAKVHDHFCGTAQKMAEQGGFQPPDLSTLAHGALDVLGFVPGVGAAADVANGILYAAEGNWGDALMSFVSAVPVVGDGVAAGKMGAKIAGNALSAAGATKGIKDALGGALAGIVHGNSKLSMKPQHGYVIYMEDAAGEVGVAKVGISGSKLNLDGSSRRANVQVNRFNKQSTDGTRYWAAVVEEGMEGRAVALEWEKTMAEALKGIGEEMPKHIRP